jgi:hypothetical protein
MKNVLEYRRRRDAKRKTMLNNIAQEAIEDGVYDLIPSSDKVTSVKANFPVVLDTCVLV